jgi:hypothetical protein
MLAAFSLNGSLGWGGNGICELGNCRLPGKGSNADNIGTDWGGMDERGCVWFELAGIVVWVL